MIRGRRALWLPLAIAFALITTTAFGQGASSTSSLSGIVQDKDGGRIPGATVVVKNDATAALFKTVTNNVGTYSFPALDAGTYTITISLDQFKTTVIKDVRLLSSTPRTLPTTTLLLGTLTETVEVTGGSELIRAESATVSSTINAEFIRTLPRADRNALNFLIFLPGVEVAGGAGNARSAQISGLPDNTINISIDGVNTSNNLQSGDGFFSLVVPRLDAIEEVTLTTATAGADSSGQGATQVRFVTRSGTNQYQMSLYEYLRHESLNTNTFFNQLAGLPKPQSTDNNYGGRIGGPIVIPGLFDGRGKAFFFFNHEESWSPNETRRTRSILQDKPIGDFTYNLANPTTRNLLQVAAQTGNTATADPTVVGVLAAIRNSVSGAVNSGIGSITTSSTDPNRETFAWLSPAASTRHSPTGRVDVNLTSRHRVSGSYYWQRFNTDPDTLNNADPTFPGLPAHAAQRSFRTTGSIGFRSTFSSNLVNQATGGWQWSPVDFFGDSTPDMFADQGFYALSLGFSLSNANPGGAVGPQLRNTVNWNIDDNLNWLRGRHNFSFGFSYTRLTNWIDNSTNVPTISFSTNTTFDPATGANGGTNMFTTGFFPGASSTDLSNARTMYALITGRVTTMSGTGRLNEAGNQYVYNGHIIQRERMDEYGLFAQDSWRWKPNLTLTLGLRYELQLPLVPTNGTFTMSTLTDLCGISGEQDFRGRQCNLFNPGSILNPDQVPTYVFYDPNRPGYDTDLNNLAPNIGVSWRPNAQQGFFRKVLGDPDQAVLSGGYTRSFNRERFDRFTAVFAGNPGATVPATRGTSATQFPIVPAGETWPLLYRECQPNNGGRCSQPAFQQTPEFPIFASGNQDIRVFDPVIQTPFTDSWSVGLQRALNRDTVIEARYVGNVNRKPWTTENWNLENIIENGLLDEFKVAQANLSANVAAGRGGTFAFFGPGTGTSPLPIFLTHFTGLDGRNPSIAGNAARYTSSNFTSATFVDDLDPFNSDPYGVAANLWGTTTFRNNMAAAGFPENFWVLNPLVDDAVVTRNLERGSNYHSLQVDLRRRFARGLQIQGSYTFNRQFSYSIPNSDFHNDFLKVQVANQPHAFKMLWAYQIPVGRGKRFGANVNKWIDGIVGGWEFSGTSRIQLPLMRLTNTNLVGMSHDEAQDALKQIRFDVDPATGSVTVWNIPEDIYTNTRLAYDTDPRFAGGYAPGLEPTGRFFQPANGPTCTRNPGAIAFKAGDCAPDLLFYGRWFGEFDFKFIKKFPMKGKATAEFSAEVFNALNSTNFNNVLNPGTSANIFRITGQQSGARTGQLVWRVSW